MAWPHLVIIVDGLVVEKKSMNLKHFLAAAFISVGVLLPGAEVSASVTSNASESAPSVIESNTSEAALVVRNPRKWMARRRARAAMWNAYRTRGPRGAAAAFANSIKAVGPLNICEQVVVQNVVIIANNSNVTIGQINQVAAGIENCPD